MEASLLPGPTISLPLGNWHLHLTPSPACLQLSDRANRKIRHPDVGPVKGYAKGTATDGEGPQQRTVARPELGDAVAVLVRDN
jgi:hypothetical protein